MYFVYDYLYMCVHTCVYMCIRVHSYLRERDVAHSVMGRRIDPSCGEPIELFLVPSSAPRLV